MNLTQLFIDNIVTLVVTGSGAIIAVAGAFMKMQRDTEKLKDRLDGMEQPEGKIWKLFQKCDDLYRRSEVKDMRLVQLEKLQALQEKDNEFRKTEMEGFKAWLNAIELKLDKVIEKAQGNGKA